MTSNYNLRSSANSSQDKAEGFAREPEFQSQSQSQAGQQSQQSTYQSMDPTQQGFVADDQAPSNDAQWGNQPGSYSASEMNPKPSGSYHFTSDQLAHPQE
ncbi:uncharacterized protein CDV56_106243 [Aspergillus thermomutatus]|uniref:Uncharacterized protein n=1 Tax=Aspergillus thermomutatus TaxID=41047 RepID=A0A397GFJ7_ASPTH|nr:uncharacterized protein CDV56_106243 [Aspergillus thermomutatus]RHZ49755.1 hypothetical protein CDV56_106243 [Aspergillus thermomutatus]